VEDNKFFFFYFPLHILVLTVFKVFRAGECCFTELVNLRSGRNLNLNFSCLDVVWSPNDDNLLATGATNGAVVLWNLAKSSKCKQLHVFQEHKRTVNKVGFNRLDGNLLISGSADSDIKMFDTRTNRLAATYTSNLSQVLP
jgi:WD40 repeat protein